MLMGPKSRLIPSINPILTFISSSLGLPGVPTSTRTEYFPLLPEPLIFKKLRMGVGDELCIQILAIVIRRRGELSIDNEKGIAGYDRFKFRKE